MPVVMDLGRGKVRLYVYSNDHGAPHVHAKAPGAEAKIRIQDGAIVTYKGFNRATLKRIVAAIAENQEQLLEAWNDYHEE